MNTNFYAVIKKIVAEQGEDVLANPQRLKGLISDYAKNEPKPERLAFGRCIEYGFYGELKKAATPEERVRVKAALAQRLHNEEGLDMEFCAGAVDVLEAVMYGYTTKSPEPPPAPAEQIPPREEPGVYAGPSRPEVERKSPGEHIFSMVLEIVIVLLLSGAFLVVWGSLVH
jgi:hypothetical protein